MRKYQPSDYDKIKEWCLLRGVSVPPEWSLPKNGFIIDDIACGFLILMDNRCAQIDFYITNPLSSQMQRSEALDEITQGLVDLAKKLEIKVLLGDTQLNSVRRLALKHGFSENGEFTHFMREL